MKNANSLFQKLVVALFLTLAAATTRTQNLFGQDWARIDPIFHPGDTLLNENNIRFVTRNVGWLITAGYINYPPTELATKIFKTSDAGVHWILQKEFGFYVSPNLFFPIDSLNIRAITGKRLVFTTDGGANWDTSSILTTFNGSGLNVLHFFNPEEGIAFNEYAWHTTDGGKNWLKGDTTGIRFTCPADVSFPNRTIGWIVGACHPSQATHSGFIAKTTDGGRTWNYQNDSTGFIWPWLIGVDFLDTRRGYAAGNNGSYTAGFILSTTDGGTTWNREQLLGGFYDIAFLDSTMGWITSDVGRIWTTTDGGVTWTVQNTGVNARLGKIVVLRKERVAYVFGDNYYQSPYVLLRANLTTAIDGTPAEHSLKFSLVQNYPNPFNGETTIKYTLEDAAHIQLKIHNLLGQEVKTLVNKEQTRGVYHTKWNGTSNSGLMVPSGVYVCRLTAGYRIEQRKMILLR